MEPTEVLMSVTIGVDPHEAMHTAVAVDRTEAELARARVRATRKPGPTAAALGRTPRRRPLPPARHRRRPLRGVSGPGRAPRNVSVVQRGRLTSCAPALRTKPLPDPRATERPPTTGRSRALAGTSTNGLDPERIRSGRWVTELSALGLAPATVRTRTRASRWCSRTQCGATP